MKGFAVYTLPLGLTRIGYDNDEVTCIALTDVESPAGEKNALTDRVFNQLSEYLDGKRKSFDFKYRLDGTDFQKRVWEKLALIPYGETRTYKDIAASVGKPGACRAVGTACNKNPLPIVIPCHRVIGSDGRLTGYAYGIEMKKALCGLEKANK